MGRWLAPASGVPILIARLLLLQGLAATAAAARRRLSVVFGEVSMWHTQIVLILLKEIAICKHPQSVELAINTLGKKAEDPLNDDDESTDA